MPMMDEEKKPDSGEMADGGLGDAAGQGTGAEQESPAEAEAVGGELQKAQAEIADLTQRLIRAQADFENYRRRVQKEKEDLAVYANQKLILNFLPVLDNLDRALATPPVEGDEKLRQGVELTARSFRDALGKEGVSSIEAVGLPFDPNVHEAVMTVDSSDHEDNVVVAEFQKGYKLGDRVIRPSMVQVCKHG